MTGLCAFFPTRDFGSDFAAIRDWAQAAEDLGYDWITVPDHVLGADPAARDGWKPPYTHLDQFHETFVTMGYLAACTKRIGLASGVLILPQRQTALVAKQAAEVDILSGGRLRLGIGTGWNFVEYEALNEDWETRGARQAEQVALMRRLWTEDLVTTEGRWHGFADAGLNPLPPQRPIPIWFGGTHPAVLRRAAKMGDGWIPSPARMTPASVWLNAAWPAGSGGARSGFVRHRRLAARFLARRAEIGCCRRGLAGARRKPADALPALPGGVGGRTHPGACALQGGGRRLLTISGGQVLSPEGGFERRDLAVADGRIAAAGSGGGEVLDASGLLVLPGIVDIHGDAFERQIMPRPGVHFPLDVALLDTDRQMAANGITTAYHAVTWSWEPGLRGRGTLVALMNALEALEGRLVVDTRLHLRIETYNLGAVDELCEWMGAGKVDLLAFNDHFEEIYEQCRDGEKIGKYAERAGLAHDAFLDLLEEVRKGASEVPAAICAGSRRRRKRQASSRLAHDEGRSEDRSLYRSLGALDF